MARKMQSQLSRFEFSFISKHITLEGIEIPLRVHIKDVEYDFDENKSTIQYHEQILDSEILIDSNEEDYTNAIELQKNHRLINNMLKFIDTELILFDDFSNTFLQDLDIKESKDILKFIGQDDLKQLFSTINKLKYKCITEFNKRAVIDLGLDRKEPYIKVKADPDMRPEYKKYLDYTDLYILMQLLIEYNTPVFFYENIGRSIDSWSYREVHLKLLYLTSKNKFDGFLNNYQASKYDTDTK